MRLVILSNNIIGKKLEVPIYNAKGMLYLNKGIELQQKHVKNIKTLGINTVYIQDDHHQVELQEILESKIRLEITQTLKKEFENIKKKNEINENIMEDISLKVINNINLSENALLYNNMGNTDDLDKLVNYSIDTALLAIKLGVSLQYNEKKLLNLGFGALFHDIGFLFTDTEEHCEIGYRLIKSNPFFSPTTSISVLQHHENFDGSGYPEKLEGTNIFEFAKIIRICSEYIKTLNSNDTSALPHQALEKVTALAPTICGQDILKEFTKSVYCYPTGLTVKLNNGLEAIVVKQNVNFPLRPIIAVNIKGKKGLINLLDHLTLFVEEVIVS